MCPSSPSFFVCFRTLSFVLNFLSVFFCCFGALPLPRYFFLVILHFKETRCYRVFVFSVGILVVVPQELNCVPSLVLLSGSFELDRSRGSLRVRISVAVSFKISSPFVATFSQQCFFAFFLILTLTPLVCSIVNFPIPPFSREKRQK